MTMTNDNSLFILHHFTATLLGMLLVNINVGELNDFTA